MPRPSFIPLASGLETELADVLVSPGATLKTENCYSPQTGVTRLRYGSDVLSTASQATVPPGGSLPVPWQLATLGGQLVRFNRAPTPLHTWSPAAEAWTMPDPGDGGLISYRRGPIKLETHPVFSGTQADDFVYHTDVAAGNGVIVDVYEVFTQGNVATVHTLMDASTKKMIYTRRTATGSREPRVLVVGTRAIVAYQIAAGNLQVDAYDLTTCALAQQVTLGTILTGLKLDMRAGAPGGVASNVSILYRSGTGLQVAIVDATNLTTNSTSAVRDATPAAADADIAFGWMQDFGASNRYAIIAADTTNGLRVLWDMGAPSGGFTTAAATHTIDATATDIPSGSTPGIWNVIGTTTNSSALGVYRLHYDVWAPQLPTEAIIRSAGRDSGIVSLDTRFRSVGLRSKLWQHAGNFYFLAAFGGTDQKTFFVLSTHSASFIGTDSETYPAPLGVAFPRGAGGLMDRPNEVSAVATGPDGELLIAVTHVTRDESISTSGTAEGEVVSVMAADIVEVKHPASVETEVGKPLEFIRSLFTPGAILGCFDGDTYAAPTFAYYPTGAELALATGGNLDPSATYVYRFLYSYVDRNGRKWRSAPSTPITNATNGTDFQFEMEIPTLRLVDRGLMDGTDGFQIEVYRTQANAPGAHFLVATIFNDPTVDSVQLTDNVADDDLGEQLYTDGGGRENQILPAVSCMVAHQGRLVVAEAGTGTIWYSLDVNLTQGLLFNEALTLDVADPSEPITGLAVYGSALFVFKRGKIYVVDGQGANSLGQGATYNFREVDSGVGCDNPQSICVATDGVWFRSSSSRAGIHRTAGGQAEYVGGGVREHNDLTITSAVVSRDNTQIRFYTLEGTTLVWDWTTKRWSTNTQQACLSATTGYGAGVVYAHASNSYILSEANDDSAAPFAEGPFSYTGKIRTPWYQAAGLGGWERIKQMQGVGEEGDEHTTTIRLYKDQDDSAPFQTLARSFDGTGERWDWEVKPERQKVSSLMVEVEISPYQPPETTETIAHNGADEYDGAGVWHFGNASFPAEVVGGTLKVRGSGSLNGNYEITARGSATDITATPAPAGSGIALASGAAVTVTYTPAAEEQSSGPGIVGIALIHQAKEGMDKLSSSRRAK